MSTHLKHHPQEFKDPVVNIALAAQVEQSLSWRSPPAQSMYLVLYQSKVFGIFVVPHVPYETMKKDIFTKYGPSQASIYHKSYGSGFSVPRVRPVFMRLSH